MKYRIRIKEFSSGDDYAHVHMEVNIPNTLSIVQVIQILKSHSASKVFQEMPNYRFRYPKGHFWGRGYFYRPVSNITDDMARRYVREDNTQRQRKLT